MRPRRHPVEKTLGPEHPSKRVGWTLGACGDASSAKALYLRCAQGYQKHFGPDYEWARKARAAAERCG